MWHCQIEIVAENSCLVTLADMLVLLNACRCAIKLYSNQIKYILFWPWSPHARMFGQSPMAS